MLQGIEMTDGSPLPLTVQQYEELALSTDQRPQDGLAFPLLGLFGEAGSLLSEAKKKHRDAASYAGYEASVVEEVGDVLWYLTTTAAHGGFSLAQVAAAALRDSTVPPKGCATGLSFGALQPAHIVCAASHPTPAFEATLLSLASEVGLLVTDFQSGKLKSRSAGLLERMVAILRALILAASEAGVTIEDAAQANIEKIFDRWPRGKIYPPLFDESFPPTEQLPRNLAIEISEGEVAGKKYVFQRCNNLNIGDRLTDNIRKADDYRFHDVFHYAYAAVLGWSPVTRALFRLKRKSNPSIDEAEDGARAILIEEGVASWIFGQAKNLQLFEGLESRGLSLSLLKHVREFVAGYESARCPLWLWEESILQGYTAFRFLKKERRGVVRLDLQARTFSISKSSQ
jgi:NTP pyrophosphatase (non-canonical NTP hydrolase)